MDIYALSEKVELSGKLKDIIDADVLAVDKKKMITAQKYYEGHNDIEGKDFRAYVANGITKTNNARSNERISHNFLELLVQQAVSYVCGNPITYKADDEQFQEFLDQNLMFDFDDEMTTFLTEARIKGKAFLHVYYDKDGSLQYTVIPSEQIIPIYQDDFKKKLQEVIRYYQIAAVNEKGEKVIRKKVEWWNAEKVMYFIEDDKKNFLFIDELPHWTTSVDTRPGIIEPHSWGRVPFIELLNNDRASSDLDNIKAHVDAYDLIQSEFVNQLADVREILIKVLGYSGTSADEILQAFRGTGIVKIDDATGNIDVLKTEIPVEARQVALKILKENIFMFGKGVDTSPEKIGTNVAGIALKMLYGALDMKCNTSIKLLKKALYEFIWFIVDDYNRSKSKSIDFRDVKFTVNKNLIINEAEIIDSLSKSKGIISDETIIENHPYVTDPTLEEQRMEKQEEKQMEQFNNAILQEQQAE